VLVEARQRINNGQGSVDTFASFPHAAMETPMLASFTPSLPYKAFQGPSSGPFRDQNSAMHRGPTTNPRQELAELHARLQREEAAAQELRHRLQPQRRELPFSQPRSNATAARPVPQWAPSTLPAWSSQEDTEHPVPSATGSEPLEKKSSRSKGSADRIDAVAKRYRSLYLAGHLEGFEVLHPESVFPASSGARTDVPLPLSASSGLASSTNISVEYPTLPRMASEAEMQEELGALYIELQRRGVNPERVNVDFANTSGSVGATVRSASVTL